MKQQKYPECECGAGLAPGIVLDPFAGSGTTALVARELGRRYMAIDLNPDYCRMVEKRIAEAARPSPLDVTELNRGGLSSDKKRSVRAARGRKPLRSVGNHNGMMRKSRPLRRRRTHSSYKQERVRGARSS